MFKSHRVKMMLVALAVSGTLLASVAESQTQEQRAGENKQMSAEGVIAGWSAKPQEVARKTIAKYGQPNEVTSSMLVWHNNGPWKRTVVYRDVVQHDFPMPHPDLLEQFIDYRVPVAKFSDLAAYDGSVIVERTKGVMSARCDKEEMNFLALNLANDIVTGKRSVADARKFYAETAMAFMKGQASPYTQGLQFQVPKGNVGDPDQPAQMMKMK